MKGSGRNAQRSVCTSGEHFGSGGSVTRAVSQTGGRASLRLRRGWLASASCHRRRRSEAPFLGEGPRDLRVGGRPADGRLGPDLDLRRGDADADPRQGQGAEPDVGVLVRADRRHRPQPLPLRRRARGGRRTGDAGAEAGDVPGRVRRARLPLRLGLEGIQGRAARSAGSSCRRTCSSPTSCRSRSSPRRPRPRSATTTRTSTSSGRRRSSATGR